MPRFYLFALPHSTVFLATRGGRFREGRVCYTPPDGPRARLPAELHTHPPQRGFVNYAEAQAVVRVIRDMLAAKGNSRPPLTLGVLALGLLR